MSYNVTTPNSINSPLSRTSAPQFLTQGIQDPVVQQNFEILSRFFGFNSEGVVPAANIVIGPAFAFNTLITYLGSVNPIIIGALQAQIPTKGNPVRVKIAPFFNSNGAVSSLAIVPGVTNPALASLDGGWVRDGKIISCSSVALAGDPVPLGSGNVPLPAFEIEDVVPAGVHTYQFYYRSGLPDTGIAFFNVNVVALELR